jgi:hypothetical protein
MFTIFSRMIFPFHDMETGCEFTENFDTAQRLSQKTCLNNANALIRMVYFSITIYNQHSMNVG